MPRGFLTAPIPHRLCLVCAVPVLTGWRRVVCDECKRAKKNEVSRENERRKRAAAALARADLAPGEKELPARVRARLAAREARAAAKLANPHGAPCVLPACQGRNHARELEALELAPVGSSPSLLEASTLAQALRSSLGRDSVADFSFGRLPSADSRDPRAGGAVSPHPEGNPPRQAEASPKLGEYGAARAHPPRGL